MHSAAGAGAGLLTGTVCRGQHDGGDPCDLAIGRAKEILDFFEEDGYAFGECVRKADRHESTKDHHPAPATIRWAGDSPCVSSGWHGSSESLKHKVQRWRVSPGPPVYSI